MKSNVYKTRNLILPDGAKPKKIHLKPIAFLTVVLFEGLLMISLEGYLSVVGMILVLVSVFGIFLLPDRYLILFLPDYMILNNQNDDNSCMVVYYEEIVSWRYDYHSNFDVFSVTLVDGSVQSIEMFSKLLIRHYMKMYAPDKEIKSIRMKEKKI